MDKRRGKSIPPGMRAIQACGDGLWELDLASGTAWFSEWFQARLGWRPEQHRQTWSALRDVMSPTSWQTLLEGMRNHLESDAPFDLELPLNVRDDRTDWWHFDGRADRDERHHPLYFSGCARDVSAARALCARLTEESSRLRSAFEAMPVAAALLDEEENIVEVNRCWRARALHSAALGDHGGIGASLQQLIAAIGSDAAHTERRALGTDGRGTLILWHDGAQASKAREDSR